MLYLLSAEHVRTLADSQTWTDNPFAARDNRRDRKRLQLTRTLAWMSLLIVALGSATVWAVTALQTKYQTTPWYIGGSGFTAIAIVVCGIHVWFIASTAQRGTLLMLTQEASRNTLMHLLTLPLSTFQIVVETAVYPWLAAMRIALLLLPVYVFSAAVGAITWLDLAMLYVVFSIASISFPLLRRPALGDTLPSTINQLSGRQQVTISSAASQGGRQQPGSSGSWITLAFMLPTISIVCAFASGRGVVGMREILHQYLPDSLIELMPSSMLSWPLLMARGLVTPLEWFGYRLSPIIFAIPLIAHGRYLQVVRTAEFLQVGTYRDLALLPTYRSRRSAESRLRAIQLFAITGYLWKWLVLNGGMSFVSGASNSRAPGQASFAYAVLFAMAWWVMIRTSSIANWLRAKLSPRARTVSHEISLARSLQFIAEPVVYASIYYCACCLVSHTQPVPKDVVDLGSKMFALTGVAALLCFGADGILGAWATLPRIFLPLAAVIGYSAYQINALRSLAFVSPTLGFFSVVHPSSQMFGGFFQGLDWHHWITTGGSTGALLTFAALVRLKSRRLTESGFRLDPTLFGPEVFQDDLAATSELTQKEDTPFVGWVARTLQSAGDNAIAVKEIRTRMRGKLDNQALRNIAMFMLVASLALYEGAPQVAVAIGGWLAKLLFGPILSPVAEVTADILCCWYIALILYSAVAAFGPIRTFSIERDKSTLGFILLTPMSNAAIVRGKAIGSLLPPGVYAVSAAVWTLLIAFVLTPIVGIRSIEAWGAIVITAGVCFGAVGMLSLASGAIAARWNVSPGCWTAILVIGTQVVVNGGRFAFQYVGDLLNSYGISGVDLYFAWLILSLNAIVFFFFVAVFAVYRMRRHDLAFSIAKRDN